MCIRDRSKRKELGIIDPGFILAPGTRVRMLTGSPGVADQGTPPEDGADGVTNYYLLLPKPYLQGAGTVLTLTLRGQIVAKGEHDPAGAAGLVTKLKVSYPKVVIAETIAGKTKDKPTPTAGKSYVVWREAGALKATLADGSAVSPEELKVLAKGQKSVGRPDVMQQIMAEHVWRVGEVVAMSPDEITRLTEVIGGADDAGKLTAMGFTLQTTDAQTATFAMTMALETAGPKGTMKVSLTGTAKVDRHSGRALGVSAAGPFEGDMGVPITGTMTATTSYAY